MRTYPGVRSLKFSGQSWLVEMQNSGTSQSGVLGSEQAVPFVKTLAPDRLSQRVMPIGWTTYFICMQKDLSARADDFRNVSCCAAMRSPSNECSAKCVGISAITALEAGFSMQKAEVGVPSKECGLHLDAFLATSRATRVAEWLWIFNFFGKLTFVLQRRWTIIIDAMFAV